MRDGDEREKKKNMRKKKELDERKIVYDISSWSETERRNEMLLKAALR